MTGFGAAGQHVYLTTYPDQLVVVDISDPSAPTQVGTATVPCANYTVTVVGPTAYLGGLAGVTVCDVSDPTQPAYLGSWVPGFDVNVFAKRDGQLLAAGWPGADGESLVVLPFDCAVAPVPFTPTGDAHLTSVFPNPFNPQTTVNLRVDRPQRATVTVYDVAGRRVRLLAERHFDEGDHLLPWNGRDDASRAVASGMYLIRLQGEAGADRKKAVLIR